jgi:hypothetical protein
VRKFVVISILDLGGVQTRLVDAYRADLPTPRRAREGAARTPRNILNDQLAFVWVNVVRGRTHDEDFRSGVTDTQQGEKRYRPADNDSLNDHGAPRKIKMADTRNTANTA